MLFMKPITIGIISNSTLEVIENAGHLPTLEQPEKTTEILKTWLMN